MDRERLIAELTTKGIPTDQGTLRVVETLGRGGNGVAFLCTGDITGELVAKVYIPPDKRDLDDQSLARFGNEVKLASAIRHPYVIPAIGAGTAQVGAYVLPYYLMPQAASTLRSIIGKHPDADEIQRITRLFLQACLGVTWLHALGVVHRDLKPENILISRDGNAWVADLGIAHIHPDFVSVGLRTMAAERLLNRDYYAPEQRFGDHADVDARADTYALGCILYELFVGTPPVRRDSPPLASVNPAFAALDPVIDRMTSYDADARYQHLGGAIVDVTLALGWVAATVRGAREPEPAEVNEMTRLLRSNNGANRSAGIELALMLGSEALPVLHNLTGHGRREVRNATTSALGQIGDERSIPFLVAGLYGNSQKPTVFRPSIDTAAESLTGYPVEMRAEIIKDLNSHIRPQQLVQLLQGFESDAAIAAVRDLHRRQLLLFDRLETPLDVIVQFDLTKTWPLIRQEAGRLGGWRLAHVLRMLPTKHQLDLARDWMRGTTRGDPWSWDKMIETIVQIPGPHSDLKSVIAELGTILKDYPGKPNARLEHSHHVKTRLLELGNE